MAKKILFGIVVLAAVALGGLVFVRGKIEANLKPVAIPEYVAVDRVEWLDQGWTPDDWQWYYHASQGGSMELPIPFDWLMNLERGEIPLLIVTEVPRIMEPEYMSRFGFLPNSRTRYDVNGLSEGWAAPGGLSRLEEDQNNNPDSLPVGFIKTYDYPDYRYTAPDGSKGRVIDAVVGFNCSACHTGEIRYNGTAIRIDGGPAMTELGMFRNAVGNALGLTFALGPRFKRFARNVLGDSYSENAADSLKQVVGDLVARGALLDSIQSSNPFRDSSPVQNGTPNPRAMYPDGVYPTWEGFSRLDAVGRIGNYVLGEEITFDNLRVADAPVNFPHIWDTPWLDWVQYNASFKQPLVRNAGEAMGVFSAVNFHAVDDPDSIFQSTVNLGNLYEMESLIRGAEPFAGLTAPAWPDHILPAVDQEAAARGEELYIEVCAGCHRPPLTRPDEFFADSLWLEDQGRRYLKLKMVPLDEIGTDPQQAMNMIERTAKLGDLVSLYPDTTVGPEDELPLGAALGFAIVSVIQAKFDSLGLSDDLRAEFGGHRSEPWVQAPEAYKARPLTGIWATPPFLHNSSVPTIYDLLGPEDERPDVFWIGSKEYDPVHLGYVSDSIPGAFRFDTSLPGNSNRGHVFSGGPDSWRDGGGVVGRALTPEERMDIIEFLKAMPPVPTRPDGN